MQKHLAAHYCFNCRYHRDLPDGVHCGWCIDFFYDHGRMPKAGDRERTTIERLWASIDSRA